MRPCLLILLCMGCGDSVAAPEISVGPNMLGATSRMIEDAEAELFSLEITFDDGGTLVVTGPDLNQARRHDIGHFITDRAAVYTPPTGAPFTWYGSLDATGFVQVEGDSGTVWFDLARSPDELIHIQGPYEGARIELGVVDVRGSSVRCRLMAFGARPEILWTSAQLAGGASGDALVITATFQPDLGINMILPRDIEPGMHLIDQETIRGFIRDDPYAGEADAGMIRIDAHDIANQRIQGSFAYDGDAIEPRMSMVPFLVNSGTFDVRYVILD